MRALVTDPFADDAISFLAWAFGPQAKYRFVEKMATGQRAGQAFMNVLIEFDRESYARVDGSLVDPFYKDVNIPAALDLITSK